MTPALRGCTRGRGARGANEPTAGEIWSQFELDAYGDWLSEEQVHWALTVQSNEEEQVCPQPYIAEVKQTWIAEATRLELIGRSQDAPGLREL